MNECLFVGGVWAGQRIRVSKDKSTIKVPESEEVYHEWIYSHEGESQRMFVADGIYRKLKESHASIEHSEHNAHSD